MNESQRLAILIVEDEKELRELMVYILRQEKYNALEAENLTSTYGKINNYKFDLLIFDLKIKQESSVDLIKYVRSSNKSQNHLTPILIVSGRIDLDTAKNLKGLINDALVKPFESKELLEKVKKLAGVSTQN